MICFPRCLYLVPGSLEWVWKSQLSCLTSMSRKLVAAFICLQKNGWENFSVCLGLYFWDSFLSWLWLPCIPESFTLCGSKAQTTLETIHNRLEKSYPTNTAVSLFSSPLGTFRQEERVRLSDRNSILMTYNLSGIWSGTLIGRRSSYVVFLLFTNWQTKDKRPQRSNVNVMNLLQKGSIFLEFILL